jgi:23S rRNA pseudoU1915 N3-methylase RlmH
MRIDLITISDGDKHLQSATDEYLKRLGKTIKLTQIKPTKHGSPQQIITADTDKLIKHLDKLSGQIVLLSKSGHQYTTEQRVELCEASHELTLII